MTTLRNSQKTNLRTVLFLASVSLIISNSCALAHTDVTAEQARDLIDSINDLIVVDVREPSEYCDAIGHIPGALNYPLSSGILETRYEELPIDSPVLVVCRSGGRSNRAANFLDSEGFSMVYDMLGGMIAWIWETEPCKQDGDNGTVSAETSTYVFLSDQSTLLQTGGIAGVNWNYSLEGHFHLTVNMNDDTAAFTHVDANATDDSTFRRTLDPNQVFNMTSLVGEFLDNTTISFTGKAVDGSDILITVTIEDNLAYLVGQTTPPPNSADFFLFSLDAVAQRKYGSGTGDPNDPYLIYTAEQLNTIGLNQEDADKCFKLMADIDLSDYKGDSFNRIGYYDPFDSFPGWHPPFTGVFDGNDHTISNFTYVVDVNELLRENGYYGAENVGLFGRVDGPAAQIKNLGLIDPNIYPAMTCIDRVTRVGAIAGSLYRGSITNCYVEGGRISGDMNVGGLVGSNIEGTISDCNTTCDVRSAERRPLRPMDEFGDTGYSIGGLVGYSRGWIYNCYATGTIQGDGWSGGLVGISDSDLFHKEREIGVISNCYASGDVTGEEEIGGLSGSNRGTISGCYALGNISGEEYVGGLVGNMIMDEGYVSDSYASGNVFGNTRVGGLVGYSNGLTENSYATGEVSGTQYVGGLIGFNGSGTILRSYGSGEVLGDNDVGGLVGRNGSGMVHHSYANGNVSGEMLVGGVAGSNIGMIHCCYAGNVVFDIQDNPAETDVVPGTVTGNEDVGGLVGKNYGEVIDCYSISTVAGDENVGGLVGDNRGSGKIYSSFWDVETSGLISSDGGIGRTTDQMRTASTFLNAGWDFMDEIENGTEDIWWIDEGQDYPKLWWELISEN